MISVPPPWAAFATALINGLASKMQREEGAASLVLGSDQTGDMARACAVSLGSAIRADKRSSSLLDLFLNTPVKGWLDRAKEIEPLNHEMAGSRRFERNFAADRTCSSDRLVGKMRSSGYDSQRP